MKAIESWVLGYLVNAVWQGAVLCAIAWLLARSMRRLGPRAEHVAWCVALGAQAVLPAVMMRPLSIRWWVHGDMPGLVVVSIGEGRAGDAMHMPSVVLDVVLATYATVLVVLALRLAGKMWRTYVLVRRAEPVVLQGVAAEGWSQACARFGVIGAETRVSDAVSGPVTVGVWRRVVIFPRGFVGQVGAAELTAAIAHECAHMQRYDFAKNLLYEALVLPVAWHPAVWLVRARVAESREIVCDAMAAESVAGGPMYARALLRLASMMIERPVQRSTHAIGVFDANRLEERVMRLTEKRVAMKGARRVVVAALCAAAGVGTLATAAELRVNVAAPAAMAGALMQSGDADATAARKVSAGVMAGNILTKVNPKYPQPAKDAKVQGAVILHAVIGKDGAIKSLQVVSGPEELTQSAVDAVQQWVYKPYLLNGQPTEVETTVTVNYSLAK